VASHECKRSCVQTSCSSHVRLRKTHRRCSKPTRAYVSSLPFYLSALRFESLVDDTMTHSEPDIAEAEQLTTDGKVCTVIEVHATPTEETKREWRSKNLQIVEPTRQEMEETKEFFLNHWKPRSFAP
jgi:hypothetical protein